MINNETVELFKIAEKSPATLPPPNKKVKHEMVKFSQS